MSDTNAPQPPYHPGPGTGHEIGVMVGFMAAFVIITAVYLVIWRVNNKRSEAKEMERRTSLAERTNPRNTRVLDEKSGDKISPTHSPAPGY